MKTLKVKITLLEAMLGTAPGNKELYSTYIEAKRADRDGEEPEVDTLPVVEQLEQGTTVFHRMPNGNPMMYDYQFKGMFKDACGCLRRVPDTESSKMKAYKKEIDGLIFVAPRKVEIAIPAGTGITITERSLRAQTAQGERIALARSETVAAGSVIRIEVMMLKESLEKSVREWLDYGKLRGLGQWRNSGMGIYSWEEV